MRSAMQYRRSQWPQRPVCLQHKGVNAHGRVYTYRASRLRSILSIRHTIVLILFPVLHRPHTFCATQCERVRVYAAQHQAVDAALVGSLQSPQWEQPSWPSSGQLAASWQAAPRQHACHPGVRRPHQLPLDWRQVAITCLTYDTGDSLRETESHLSKGSFSVLLRACRLSIGGLCLAGVAFVLQTYMV